MKYILKFASLVILVGYFMTGCLKPIDTSSQAGQYIKMDSSTNQPNSQDTKGIENENKQFTDSNETADSLENKIPLIDIGLYSGTNVRPSIHTAAGLQKVSELKKLDTDGNQFESGKIVFLGLGASTPRQEFMSFISKVEFHSDIIPVDGCQGGKDINYMLTENKYWLEVDKRLSAAGAGKKQVQIIWLETDDLRDQRSNAGRVEVVKNKYLQLFKYLQKEYPNLKMIYLAARVTTQYTENQKHGEPKGYYHGLMVQSIINEHIEKSDYSKYWIDWGYYNWCNGDAPRKTDGFYVEKSDFKADGVHLSDQGVEKMGEYMKNYYINDEVGKAWITGKK